jgi:hypothetical protein
MSANTAVSSKKNSIVASPKFRTFVLVFSLSAIVLYVLGILLGLASFTYHPATGRLEWGQTMPRRNEGPVMYWYGWILTAFIGASIMGFLATLIPETVTRRIPLALLWIIPLLALPIFVNSLLPK